MKKINKSIILALLIFEKYTLLFKMIVMIKKSKTQVNFFTIKSLKWVIKNKAYTLWHLRKYCKFFYIKYKNPEIVFNGMVFFGKNFHLNFNPNFSYVEFGKFVHIGDNNSFRFPEGYYYIGNNTVTGTNVVLDGYYNIDIGANTLIADNVTFIDYDHNFDNPHKLIRKQGISKDPIKVDDNCWIGTKTTILRMTYLETGVVVGANSVVKGHFSKNKVIVGSLAREVKDIDKDWIKNKQKREKLKKDLADIERKKRNYKSGK